MFSSAKIKWFLNLPFHFSFTNKQKQIVTISCSFTHTLSNFHSYRVFQARCNIKNQYISSARDFHFMIYIAQVSPHKQPLLRKKLQIKLLKSWLKLSLFIYLFGCFSILLWQCCVRNIIWSNCVRNETYSRKRIHISSLKYPHIQPLLHKKLQIELCKSWMKLCLTLSICLAFSLHHETKCNLLNSLFLCSLFRGLSIGDLTAAFSFRCESKDPQCTAAASCVRRKRSQLAKEKISFQIKFHG